MRCDICSQRFTELRQATVNNMLVAVCPECDPREPAPAVDPEPAPARRTKLRCDICSEPLTEVRQAVVNNMPLLVCPECDPLTTVEFF